MTSSIYLAIDTPILARATELVRQVRNHIGGIKLGLEFFCANGHHGVHEMRKLGLPIFLDLKLHDIPNTVAKAVQALHPLEPAILTVHAAGGRAMMEDAKAAAGVHTKVVAVTVLTSLDKDDLDAIGVVDDPRAQVERLARLAKDAGARRHRLLGRRSRACAADLAERLFRGAGRAAGRHCQGRPEARRHAARSHQQRCLDPGDRPRHHARQRAGHGGAGDRGDTLVSSLRRAEAGHWRIGWIASLRSQ